MLAACIAFGSVSLSAGAATRVGEGMAGDPPPAPSILPNGRDFPDSLSVKLVSADTSAAVFYTLDGTLPDTSSRRYLGVPIRLDSSAVVTATAYRTDAGMGAFQLAVYRLVPGPLKVSPQGGAYPAGTRITLTATTSKAGIRYSWDGSVPDAAHGALYDGPVELAKAGNLKAVAFVGAEIPASGPVFSAGYLLDTPGPRVLKGLQAIALGGGYDLEGNDAAGAEVKVSLLGIDSLGAKEGFRGHIFALRVQGPEAAAFPRLLLRGPSAAGTAFYGALGGGKAAYLGSGVTVQVPGPGLYFAARDTSAPRIEWLKEEFTGDSTEVTFAVADNVANLEAGIERSDDPQGNIHVTVAGGLVTVRLANPTGPARPLDLRLRVSDGSATARFPADTALRYPVAQRWARLPAPALRIGRDPAHPWDMFSVPLELAEPITLQMLRRPADAQGLRAMEWDPVAAGYREMGPTDVLLPGHGYWLGRRAVLAALDPGPAAEKSRRGNIPVTLRIRPGWNQVANPGLRTLWWPADREAPGYAAAHLKGFHVWSASGGAYLPCDSLEAWKAGFAWYGGASDTVVTLLSAPPVSIPKAVAKSGAGFHFAARLSLCGSVLRIGAEPWAADGMGIEDELLPPAVGERAGIWSQRGRAVLGTDFVRWNPKSMGEWRVIANLPRASAASVNPASVNPASGENGLRVEGVEAPEGYGFWIVLPSRGLAFPLAAGTEIPLLAGAEDTLRIEAGPLEELARRHASLPAAIAEFSLEVVTASASPILRLRSPGPAEIAWEAWDPQGKRIGYGNLRFLAGSYAVALGISSPWPAGPAWVRVRWRASGRVGAFTRPLPPSR